MDKKKLEIVANVQGKTGSFKIIGNIDEDFSSSTILENKLDSYIFDFQALGLINSCGIREWINMLDKFDKKSTIVYQNCPAFFVHQMNMVDGILNSRVTVQDFMAPYFCESCDQEKKVHLKSSDVISGKAHPKIVTNVRRSWSLMRMRPNFSFF